LSQKIAAMAYDMKEQARLISGKIERSNIEMKEVKFHFHVLSLMF
jgi:hypothetical protein